MISSGCCLFGNGTGCLLEGVTGAVAFGEATIVSRWAGVRLVCLLLFVVAVDIVNVVLSVLYLLFCVSL